MKIYFSLIFVILSGCMVGPNYSPPPSCIPDAFTTDVCDLPTIVNWWEEFQDPMLNQYIERAAMHNQNVLVAQAAICQSRAVREITRADLYPQISADINALRLDLSKNGPIVGLGGIPSITQIGNRTTLANIYTSILDASWEIDIFGKIRRQIEVANAEIQSAIEHKNDILLSVLAEVARNYIDLRSAQQKRSLIEQNIALQEEKLRIVQKQVQKGYTNKLVLENSDAALFKLKATLPPISAQINQYIYALSVLTGALPEALFYELSEIGDLPVAPNVVCCGLRSDLIKRRPDIREAERNLASATSNIGVAVASFFPSFSLLGAFGFQSLHFHNWFQAASKTWVIGSNVSMPIFQGGRLVGNLHLSEAQAITAGFSYQQTVLNALEEVEGALIKYIKEMEARDALQRVANSYEAMNNLTNERYKKGLVDLSQTFDSQLAYNNALLDLLQRQTDVLLNSIALYKALGGGWEEMGTLCPILGK